MGQASCITQTYVKPLLRIWYIQSSLQCSSFMMGQLTGYLQGARGWPDDIEQYCGCIIYFKSRICETLALLHSRLQRARSHFMAGGMYSIAMRNIFNLTDQNIYKSQMSMVEMHHVETADRIYHNMLGRYFVRNETYTTLQDCTHHTEDLQSEDINERHDQCRHRW